MKKNVCNQKIILSKKVVSNINKYGYDVKSETDSGQIENLLCGGNEYVKIILAKCTDFKMNKVQIERGLTDDSEEVRAAFARRTDYKPTCKQLERGLTDIYRSVRYAFFRRDDVILSDMQKIRAKRGSFNVFSSSSMEEHDEPDVICPLCKTWIIAEPDTWCKHLAYIYAPPEYFAGIERGPAAKAQYEKWLMKNGADLENCSRKNFNLLCGQFNFIKRNVRGSDYMGFECGTITYAFADQEKNKINSKK